LRTAPDDIVSSICNTSSVDNIKTNVGNSKAHHVGGPTSLQIKQNVSNQLLVYEKSRYLEKGTLYASEDKCLHTWLKCTP
jgi:hypothetical protein